MTLVIEPQGSSIAGYQHQYQQKRVSTLKIYSKDGSKNNHGWQKPQIERLSPLVSLLLSLNKVSTFFHFILNMDDEQNNENLYHTILIII
jgi:hypothetical protein